MKSFQKVIMCFKSQLHITILFMVLLGFISNVANAQKELKLIEDEAASILSSLGGNSSSMERAMMTKEDERSITVSLRFKGFDDKEYQIQVAVLNSRKEPIEAIPVVVADMPKSKQADLSLAMLDPQKTMAQSTIQSKFLRVRVKPKSDGISGLLEDSFDDINLNSTEFMYELDKKWMLMGANVKVAVKLTPYKNAASIPSQ